MKFIRRQRFIKQYAKLPARQQRVVDKALILFATNPHDPRLHNHLLKGSLKGKHAIAAAFDLRIVFIVEGKYEVVTLLAVGSHEEVY